MAERAGLKELFTTLKDIGLDHMKDVWSPFERTRGKNIVQDIFSNEKNTQKLGLRIVHIALATLLGLTTLTIASTIIHALPISINFLLFLAVIGFGAGITMTFFPQQVDQLVQLAAAQVAKLRAQVAK